MRDSSNGESVTGVVKHGARVVLGSVESSALWRGFWEGPCPVPGWAGSWSEHCPPPRGHQHRVSPFLVVQGLLSHPPMLGSGSNPPFFSPDLFAFTLARLQAGAEGDALPKPPGSGHQVLVVAGDGASPARACHAVCTRPASQCPALTSPSQSSGSAGCHAREEDEGPSWMKRVPPGTPSTAHHAPHPQRGGSSISPP